MEWLAIAFTAGVVLLLVHYLRRRSATPLAEVAMMEAAGRAAAGRTGERPVPLPRIDYEEDEDVDPTKVGQSSGCEAARTPPPTVPILHDQDAEVDEPTHAGALILISATAQTDRGLRRKRNEDSLLVVEKHSLFVV